MEIVEKVIVYRNTNANRQLVLMNNCLLSAQRKSFGYYFIAEDVDIDEKEWLRSASVNPAFDFLKEQEEDIYTLVDGNHSMTKVKLSSPLPFDDFLGIESSSCSMFNQIIINSYFDLSCVLAMKSAFFSPCKHKAENDRRMMELIFRG